MRRTWWLAPVLVGCSDGNGTDTDGSTPVPPVPAACAVQADNPLRFACHVSRTQPGPVDVTITEAGEVRMFPGDPDALEQDVIVYDLMPSTTFDWEIHDGATVEASGTSTTGALPTKAQVHLEIQVPGTPIADRLLVPVVCAGEGASLVVFDDHGHVRWWQEPPGGAFPVAFGRTEDGLIAVAAGRNQFYAWTADGTLVQNLSVGEDLDRPMHHSLTGEHGDLLVLDATAEPKLDGLTYVNEGVTRIHPDGTSERAWDFFSIFDPTGLAPPPGPISFGYWSLTFADAVDYAHVNGIAVTGDDDWLISIKNLDTVIRLDPTGPTVRWALAGSNRSVGFPDQTLTVVGPETLAFEAPHTPRLAPWGSLLVMDNGILLDESRVLEIAVDDVNGTAELVRSWGLGSTCPVHGSVWGLPDGSVFAACAATGQLYELDDTGIRWQAHVACDGEGQGLLLGAQPIVATY